MYLCPRAHCAFHLSAGEALIHSVPSRLRPFPAAPALVPFFVPRHPPWRSSAPSLRSHTRLPRLSSPSRLPVSFAGNGNAAENSTSRAKIHRDFNTFNSFIIRFAPTPRAGNADDVLHFSSLFFSLSLTVKPRHSGCSCSSQRLRQPENGCIDGIRVR